MDSNHVHRVIRAGLLVPAVLLCVAFANVWAEEPVPEPSVLANDHFAIVLSDTGEAPPDSNEFPLVINRDAGLDFDLGGIEERKLQLQLEQPLSLHMGSRARTLDNGGNMLGLDATLNMPVSDNFNLSASIDRELGNSRFQSLGSIQCMNGVLRSNSYTASGCRFIDEQMAQSSRERLGIGASMDFSQASASINWFTQGAELDQRRAGILNQPAGEATFNHNLLSPNLGNPMLSGNYTDPMQYLNSETSGVDLNFRVGIATQNNGDIKLGLAFAHILDAEYQGLYANGIDALSWTVAEPFDTASVNLEWNRGSISGGVQGFYRDSVDFLNRNTLDSLTTFDVHFTWRTPWKADLTIGAANVLNAGAEDIGGAENQPIDPLESIYGRIPYVRYKQDL